jgi:hypothetical protein
MRSTRQKILFGILKGAIAFLLAAPLGGFAASASAATTPASAGNANITIEYRYTEGEEGNVSIPSTIERYGRTYRLLEQRPAVLETTLEATRTYSWSIDGFITEAEAEQLKAEFPGLVLTPVTLEGAESADRLETITGLPTNDVDAIAYTITDAQGEFRRAAVRFEIEKDENGAPKYDAYGLPASYKAEVVYRGLAGVSVPGYYSAAQTYETKEALDGVAQYVIVTIYAPVVASTAGATSTESTGGTGSGAAAQTGTDADNGPIEIGSLVQTGEETPAANTGISDMATPQTAPPAGNFAETAKAILLLVLKIVLIAIVAFAAFIVILILRNKVRRQRRRRAHTVSSWENGV